MAAPRDAQLADWLNIDTCNFLGEDIEEIYAILSEVRKYFVAAETNGQSNLQDILTGLKFGDNDETSKFRVLVVSGTNSFEIQINSGTDSSPTWSPVGSFGSSGLDHGTLAGLGDDDHPHYSRADGAYGGSGRNTLLRSR